jgi:hypothetical protein
MNAYHSHPEGIQGGYSEVLSVGLDSSVSGPKNSTYLSYACDRLFLLHLSQHKFLTTLLSVLE